MAKSEILGWERNTEGIKAAAQKKREAAFAKTEEAIKTLIREKKPVNFESVAEAAGVTRAWLYKQPEIRSRIEFLRQQQSPKKALPPALKASDASKDAVIKTLKQRIKKLEDENKELRRQVEVAYGLMQPEALESFDLEILELRKENQRLMNLLNLCRVEVETLKEQKAG